MHRTRTIQLGDYELGGERPFFLIAGPCVIEGQDHCLKIARHLKAITEQLGIPFVFKASYDKANRTSLRSYRGPGLRDGLKILAAVKERVGVPILSDVHSVEEAKAAEGILDVLQIPAFLSRQTDLILAAARTDKIVNLKKGQFLAPADVRHAVEKVTSTGNRKVLVTERGTSFGYHNLVVDFRSLPILRSFGCPVVFDATHSVQLPGGRGSESSGQSEFIETLARAAVAVCVDGLFFEVHENPAQALSDSANALPLEAVEGLLKRLKRLDEVAKNRDG